MDLTADAANAALAGIVQKCRYQASANSFGSPLVGHEHGNDVHGLTAEFGAPFIASRGITAESRLVFGHQHNAQIARLYEALKYSPRILGSTFGADLRQQLRSQFAKLVQVGCGRRTYAMRAWVRRCHGIQRPCAKSKFRITCYSVIVFSSPY